MTYLILNPIFNFSKLTQFVEKKQDDMIIFFTGRIIASKLEYNFINTYLPSKLRSALVAKRNMYVVRIWTPTDAFTKPE